jgi:uncharacterized membrane protein HdeD (DUF308 family)
MIHTLSYFTKNLTIVIGLVLIWRGVWYVLDAVDILYLGGNHIWSGVAGIIIGLFVLYVPDHDLKEISKL